MAASFQEAVVDVLVAKARAAAARGRGQGHLPGRRGGRQLAAARAASSTPAIEDGLHGFLPSRPMCTDNAAMVAAAGWWRLAADGPTPLDAGAYPEPAPARRA